MTAVCTWPSGEILGAPDRDELIEARPFQLAQWAMEYQGDPTRKLLLITLALKANSHGVTWVGQDKLAEACCVTICTVGRHLAVLEAENLIRRYHRYESNGRKKARNSDVTMMAPCLPATYLAKCVVGPTRENVPEASTDDLPSIGATLHPREVGDGSALHGCAVDLTSTNDLPSAGATLHPCNDLPRVGAPDLPSTGAGVSISKEDLEEGSITPFVDPASGDDRLGDANAERLFPTTDLPGELSKKRVPVNHDGETLWFDTEADAVFGLWVRLHGKQSTTVFSDGRKEKVGAALRKVGLARCLDAVRGNALSEWHQGDNEAGRKYHDLVNIFRNATTRDQAEMYWNEPEKRRNGYSRFARTGRGQRGSLAAPLPTAADFGDDEDAEKNLLHRAYRTGCDEARRARPDAGEAAWQEHGKAKARELREKLRAGV